MLLLCYRGLAARLAVLKSCNNSLASLVSKSSVALLYIKVLQDYQQKQLMIFMRLCSALLAKQADPCKQA
jgi:hypothetical protein